MANFTFDDLPLPAPGYPTLTDNFGISPTNLADPTYKYTWQEVITFIQSNLTLTMQDIYDNSVTAGMPFVNLAVGNPPQNVSTQTAVALVGQRRRPLGRAQRVFGGAAELLDEIGRASCRERV